MNVAESVGALKQDRSQSSFKTMVGVMRRGVDDLIGFYERPIRPCGELVYIWLMQPDAFDNNCSGRVRDQVMPIMGILDRDSSEGERAYRFAESKIKAPLEGVIPRAFRTAKTVPKEEQTKAWKEYKRGLYQLRRAVVALESYVAKHPGESPQ